MPAIDYMMGVVYGRGCWMGRSRDMSEKGHGSLEGVAGPGVSG